MGESWYLACDFQLFIIGTWIVPLIWMHKKPGIIFLVVLMGVSCAIPGILTYVNDWPMQLFPTITSDTWMNGFYVKFYTRSPVYIWGLILGYILHSWHARPQRLHKVFG